jgi:hypothetical protein
MTSNACANSITSLPSADNWPLRGVDLSRNCFGPKPRKYGAMVQKPPVENKTVGVRIEDPAVDFASNAKSYGVWGAGPVTEPKDLAKRCATRSKS